MNWRCAVGLRASDGSLVELGPGDIIGRGWNASLQLDDPRVSEAHAMVSHRDGALWMLALRRRVAVNAESRTEVELEPGLTIQLADGVAVAVEYVILPDTILGLEGPGLGARPLSGVGALRVRPRVELLSRFDDDAAVLFWSTGLGMRARAAGGEVVDVVPGQVFEVEGRAYAVIELSGTRAAATPTRADGAVDAPLRIVCRYDTVHIVRIGRPVVVLSGLLARLLSEIATVGKPVGWEGVAIALWPEVDDRSQLRRRWDVQMSRLRARLRAAGVRGDLVRPDGKGNFELVLGAEDVMLDET
ncbi:MAG: FHA domain-containing protein [Myxococcota bacterium]